jgi:hypothetical protein
MHGRSCSVTKLAKAVSAHDGELHLVKQRNGSGEVGSKYLWHVNLAKQFVELDPNAADPMQRGAARRYLPDFDVSAEDIPSLIS